jgi:hypothetical protein
MDLEHRQIIAGSLDHDLPPRLLLRTRTTLTTTEEGLYRSYVEQRSGPIDHALKDLVQAAAFVEKQVAAVLRLIDRKLEMALPFLGAILGEIAVFG